MNSGASSSLSVSVGVTGNVVVVASAVGTEEVDGTTLLALFDSGAESDDEQADTRMRARAGTDSRLTATQRYAIDQSSNSPMETCAYEHPGTSGR